MSIVIDVLSLRYGKLRICEDMNALPSEVVYIPPALGGEVLHTGPPGKSLEGLLRGNGRERDLNSTVLPKTMNRNRLGN